MRLLSLYHQHDRCRKIVATYRHLESMQNTEFQRGNETEQHQMKEKKGLGK
jgi:hypothetical protein